jgi:surfeit locus 1 family protein
VDTQPREVRGLLDELPQPGIRAGDAGINKSTWPQLLNYPKADELKLLYSDQLLSPTILLDADQPDGYARFWSIDLGFIPERHIGYAIQWFGLALTLLIIYVAVNLKRADHIA